MIIIRPIALDDFDALHQIAIDSGNGFTSFPDDRQVLLEKIEHSLRSFADNVTEPGAQNYLFVMQDLNSGEVVGTSGIVASVGQEIPLYHHRIEHCVLESAGLDRRKNLQTLTLGTDLVNSTEICSLYLKESYRINGNGRALSRFRFLFMAANAHRFSMRIMAEMRGYADDQGLSPFWSWFEQHFCDLSFAITNHYIGIGDMRFASELMPKHPLYISLMSESAQQAINKVHPDTIPALALLEKEGFSYGEYIGVNDAGPALICPLQQIEAVMMSELRQVVITDNESEQSYLVCNHKLASFRAAQINACITQEHVLIGQAQATALNVNEGDWLTLVGN
jgi:arginine N-succinyltransferase